ncbi:Hypothetical protein SMAX5B_007719 [Scophthalmus maximus]|uniref:Uncharacterized protein n=1 Tax=Scophthalmus maximus TaxID=52904 RepID=A0A2U9BB64_SCOMX|nr:Hypothetical protein SMAX5B_007719 [Scophthalmus maximus]
MNPESRRLHTSRQRNGRTPEDNSCFRSCLTMKRRQTLKAKEKIQTLAELTLKVKSTTRMWKNRELISFISPSNSPTARS